MRLRFWGTRGSLPKPGPNTLKYGGNTSCLEVRTSSDQLLIVDCGTGIHSLGQHLLGSRNKGGHILISHTHWDHIQGIPFFAPFFDREQQWHIYAPRGFGPSLRETLAGQMQYSYFPIRLDDMGARISFHELNEGTFCIEDVRVTSHYLNHTALTLGFKLEADGVSFVYASDHEPYARHLAEGCGHISGRDLQHVDFMRGAELVIHDAQFTNAEYPTKTGWGHSTIEYAVAVAGEAGATHLALTHHDPLRTDDQIDHMVSSARQYCEYHATLHNVFAAAEGQEIDLTPATADGNVRPVSGKASVELETIKTPVLVLAVSNSSAQSIIRDAATSDNIVVCEAESMQEAILLGRANDAAIIVLDLPSDDQLTTQDDLRQSPIPIIYMVDADRHDVHARDCNVPPQDVLIAPFSVAYARTLIRSTLLRASHRWERPAVPEFEEQRLSTLQGLRLLDTHAEDRFDRITRLAASTFDVPTALISLVDRDRQWFKSAVGTCETETSRDVSFCAHAVAAQEVLVVQDTHQDDRFADNPLVTGAPHIRFYAGAPIFSGGFCIGTVCVLDSRPHAVGERSLQLLRDLAALVEGEIAKAK